MQGDNTRETFEDRKHYQQVRMQQGRVQTDADWNEQSALLLRRDETTATDLIGHCGGPADEAAFGIFTDAANLPPAAAAWLNALPPAQRNAITAALLAGDFLLSPGRYYVDGVQCELEEPVLYSQQPDRLDATLPAAGTHHVVYLDVWQRHLTALNDPAIREPALGGPDTAARVKTVWQVKLLALNGVNANDPCHSGDAAFKNLADPGTAMLTADTEPPAADDDPCLVPAGAGFRGLENQFYRVEIHNPGAAIDANGAAGVPVTLPGPNDLPNTITAGGSWNAGEAVEIFTGTAKMKGTLAWITGVGSQGKLTLDRPVAGFVQADNPQLRRAGATWKGSRENGSVLAAIERIAANKITVGSLGQDEHLGFAKDAWVEILDDKLELGGQPGQIAQIDNVDVTNRIITLKTLATPLDAANPNGVNVQLHPVLRRWDFVGAVRFVNVPADNWIALESGIRVRFADNGKYLTGQYWQIPARTATASSPAGDIEWPRDAGQSIPQPPRGITHHFCRLGLFSPKASAPGDVTDCRCLFPALSAIPRLFYVSGDGQEVMPDLTDTTGKRYKLPQPLIVGVANAHCLKHPAMVHFFVSLGGGQVAAPGGAPANFAKIATDIAGLALCDFYLEGAVHAYSQQVTAVLLDAIGNPVSLPLIFNANLSVASEVAYDPGDCKALENRTNVQAAISELAALVRIDQAGGDGQDTDPGQPVPNEIIVRVSNSCGAVKDATVTFTAADGFVAKDLAGIASSTDTTIDVLTDADGIARCRWRTAVTPTTQQLLAEITALPSGPALEAHRSVLFTANLRAGGGCCVTVGQGGEFDDLNSAISKLTERGVKEICICLLSGDHPAFELVLDGTSILRQVHIHGCGLASRIILGAALVARTLDAFSLKDLCIHAHQPGDTHAVVIEECKDVTITGCQLQQSEAGNDWITISAAQRIHIADNVIKSSQTITRIEGRNAVEAAPTNARLVAETAAASLASKSQSERAAFVKEFRQIVKDVPRGDPKKKPLAAALKHLSTKSSAKRKSVPAAVDAPMMASVETPRALAESVTEAVANRSTVLVPALVIVDANAETTILNNIITGEVRLYGGSGAYTPAKFEAIAGLFPRMQFFFQSSGRTLRIEGNVLTKVVVDKSIDPGINSGALRLFARLSILDNTFHALGNQWLAAYVISNGNHFIPIVLLLSDHPLALGTAAATSFICMGTSCPNIAELTYGVTSMGLPAFEAAANLIKLRELP